MPDKVAHKGQSFCFAESMRTDCTILSSGKSSEIFEWHCYTLLFPCSIKCTNHRSLTDSLVPDGVTMSHHLSISALHGLGICYLEWETRRQWLVGDDKVQHSPTIDHHYSMEYHCQNAGHVACQLQNRMHEPIASTPERTKLAIPRMKDFRKKDRRLSNHVVALIDC